ncbi:MAG: hypothetical protein ABJA87_00100 [bacterium]
MTDADERRVLVGQALLDALLDSDLAQDDDRRIATRLLRESALAPLGPVPPQLPPLLPPQPAEAGPGLRPEVDDVEFVQDDGDEDAPKKEDR